MLLKCKYLLQLNKISRKNKNLILYYLLEVKELNS